MLSMFQMFKKKLLKYGLEYFKLYYGTYRGTCMDNKDPEEQGRIKVRVPAVSGRDTIGVWAWPMTPWSGKDSGMFVVPDIGDPVYVCFEGGKPEFPIWTGGWWPKPKSGNFAPSAYKNGSPTKRVFKTKAGHEFSFDDNQDSLSCRLIWHNPETDKYSFLVFTKDGSLQMANHKGGLFEMRATDDDELTLIMDKSGNMISQDKDGTKISDQNGNVIFMGSNGTQVTSDGNVVINASAVNMKAGGVTVSNTDIATDSVIKGTTWLAWWIGTFFIWLSTHTHPTPTGISGPPSAPPPQPSNSLLTDKLKVS